MISINESFDQFRELRESGVYYADKTELLYEYLEKSFKKAILFTRPKRFGKTLTMTMFRDFLDITQDNRKIFEGLAVMNHTKLIDDFMNQYPVVFLSLKDVYGDTFESAFEMLRVEISRLCEANRFLLNSIKVSDASKLFFERLQYREGNVADTIQALDLLAQMMHSHFGYPAFILIDEYDTPMTKTAGYRCHAKVQDMIEKMLSLVCKTNYHVKGVLLSGVLHTVKNSSYESVNNIITCSVLSPEYDSMIGFTEEDVKKLLTDAGLEGTFPVIRDWYDGYIFGNRHMYCPWDVLRHVSSILCGAFLPLGEPMGYWSDNALNSCPFIKTILSRGQDSIENLEQLIAGKTIEKYIDDSLPNRRDIASEESLWGLLLESGYLTKSDKEVYELLEMRIPNRRIQYVFQREVWAFLKNRIPHSHVNRMIGSLWAGDKNAQGELSLVLAESLGCFQTVHEYTSHMILCSIFTGLRYQVRSEQALGYGRSNLVVLDPAKKRGLILMLKHPEKQADHGSLFSESLIPAAVKEIAAALRKEGYQMIRCYSITCYQEKKEAEDIIKENTQ